MIKWKRCLSYPGLGCFILIGLLSSCSLQQQLHRSAKKDLLAISPIQAAHIGISLYEPATGKYWYNHNGGNYFVPASNTKIPTAYAAMKYLGDSLIGLHYQVIDSHTIVIAGTGDPSFLHPDFKRHPVLELLKKYKTVYYRGGIYDDFLGSGWSWGDYKAYYMAQRSDWPIYGNTVRFAQKGKEIEVYPSFFRQQTEIIGDLATGFQVDKPWDSNSFLLTNGNMRAAEVPFNPIIGAVAALVSDTIKATVTVEPLEHLKDYSVIYSQPTDSVLRPLLHRSDNFFAEQTLLMVSQAVLGEMNDAKIIDTLLKTDFKDLPQAPRWVDGSGLSRYNLFTPQDFIFILDKMKNEFGKERIKVVFPTGGTGTLGNLYIEEKGFIYAKTGTLSGVLALSGFLTTKKNKELVFSILVNNHNGSAADIRRAMESFLKKVRNSH